MTSKMSPKGTSTNNNSESVSNANRPTLAARVSFKQLWQFIRPEGRLLLWGCLFLALGSSMVLVFPQTIKLTIDQALTQKNQDMIDRLGLAMLVVLILQSISAAARYFLFTYAGERIVKNIRYRLFSTLMRQEIGFFDGQMTGDLMSRLTTDAAVLQNALSVNISMILRSAVAAIGGLALLFYTSPKLTFALLAILPPAALMAAWFSKRIKGMSHAVQEAIGGASAVAEESISNIRTVRSFAAENIESQRYDNVLTSALGKTLERIRLISKFMGLISLIGLTGITAVVWYGAGMVLSGELSIGTLSAYILYTLTVAISFGTLGGLWTDFMSALGAASRIFFILDRKVELSSDGTLKPESVEGAISLSQVTFAYPTRPDVNIFSNLNLEIGSGEVIALVGPSGSGKSTIATLVQRFYDPISGCISLDGNDLRSLQQSWLHQQIGTVSQEPILMSTSIWNNIAYSKPDALEEEVHAAARLAHADEFIEGFPDKYQTRVGERGLQLSGGQRQRIAIARAALKNPRILILDEATSALDAENEYLVQAALENLMKGRTTIIIAHRLSTVRRVHRVVVLNRGAIVEMGPPDALLQNKQGFYYGLVEKQILS